MGDGGARLNLNRSPEAQLASFIDLVREMTVEGIEYIRGSSWGAVVLLKASGRLVCGAADILNVAFSGGSALRLGCLFACTGIGSLIGSSIVNSSTDLKHKRRR